MQPVVTSLAPYNSSASARVTAYPQQQQQRNFVTAEDAVRDRYIRRQCLAMGIIQLLAGVFCVVLGAVSLGLINGGGTYRGYVGYVNTAYGIWIGALIIVSGALGIAASKSWNRCMIIAFLVTSLVSASASIILIVFGVIDARLATGNVNYDRAIRALSACLAAVGFLEALAAIWGAVVCCNSSLCFCGSWCYGVPVVDCGYANEHTYMVGQTGQGSQFVLHPSASATTAIPKQQNLIYPSFTNVQPGWASSQNLGCCNTPQLKY